MLSNVVFAQNTFEKIITNPNDQVIRTVIEDELGNFVMVGDKTINDIHVGYIIKIDSAGNLLQETTIQQTDTSSCFFYSIHCFNEQYYLIGFKNIDTVSDMLLYLKLNSNLEIDNERLLNIPDNRQIQYINSIFDSDSNFVVTGYTTRMDTNIYGNPFVNFDVYFYKLNIYGDSLVSKFYTTDASHDLSYDIIESHDSSKYYAFVLKFTNIYGTAGQMLTLSKNLDSLNIDSIPLSIKQHYSPTYINETDILLCGLISPFVADPHSLSVISMNEQSELINFNQFKIEGDMRDFPSFYNGISKNEDNIYVGGTSNMSYTNPSYSTFDSWFHLIKINPDITPIWEYWYGGDAYYVLYSILATNDGGCLMVGCRYDYETQNQERDIYIVKVNSNGLIVWTQEIPVDKQLTTVFPNPGTTQLNINTYNEQLDFELINISGQVLISQIVNSNAYTINTESIKSGMYFFKLIDQKGKIIETGKWIKQ